MHMKRFIFMAATAMIAATSAWSDTVTTEAELRAALVGEYINIELGADITLSSYWLITRGQIVTLDLNGHTLRRSGLTAADRNGHVIEVDTGGSLTINDDSSTQTGTITGGWAINGGGICNYGYVAINGGTITGCKADDGGAIKNNDGAELGIGGGVITNCTSATNGGAISNFGMATMSGATIRGNTAKGRGGAIWTSGYLDIGTATITGNQAKELGGGIYYANGSTGVLNGTVISGNSSPEGGGLNVEQTANITFYDPVITDNTSTVFGGGGITNYGTLDIDGLTVTGNTCPTEGGGIWNNGTLKMKGTVTVQDNARISGLTNNVYLRSDHVINVTGSLGNSRIGLTVQGNNGVATSGLRSNGNISNFTNDRAEITNLAIVSGQVKITPKSDGIYYVERGWDNENKRVTETLKVRAIDDNITELDNVKVDENYHGPIYKIEKSGWFFISGNKRNLRYYSIRVMEGIEAHLILCDGGYLHIDRAIILYNNSTLSIYGQLEDTGTIENDPKTFGIGRSSIYDEANTLNIHGGTIKATGAEYSAGIGGFEYSNGITVNIYGGNVKATGGAYAAGIGSGYQGRQNHSSGGTTTIYGGYVEARGGELGAGIGAGEDCNGGTVSIHGGTVYAYGGNDGAGIGCGQDRWGGTHAGTITITGGHVYAYGNDVAAGIGAGEDADMGNITITGGIVEAHGGGGESWAMAIATDDDNEGVNSITLGDNMMVSSERDFTHPERIDAVKGRQDVIVKPCEHNGATYTVNGTTANGTHTMHCTYCKYGPTETHTFVNGTCSVCHVSGSTSTVSIYLPEKVGDSYTDGHYASTPRTQTLVTGSTFDLPAPPVTYLPSGVIFAGWRVGTPDGLGITSYWVGDNEQVLEPGTSYTVSADVSLTARYTGINISLANDASNSETLYDYNGKIAQTVTLADRTLYKDGTWNTLCLSFDINDFSGTPLEGATVMTLSNSTGFNASTGTLTLDFVSANTIQAGHAYIVKWETTGDPIVNPTFTSVTISNEDPADQSVVSSDGRVQFRGIYNPTNIYTAAKKSLYLGDDNKLHSPDADMTLNAFRAYFQLASTSEGTGDVNDDGRITIADVTALVNIILGKDTAYNFEVADVNGDGTITIADVTALVNIILGKDSIILNTVTVDGAAGITFE